MAQIIRQFISTETPYHVAYSQTSILDEDYPDDSPHAVINEGWNDPNPNSDYCGAFGVASYFDLNLDVSSLPEFMDTITEIECWWRYKGLELTDIPAINFKIYAGDPLEFQAEKTLGWGTLNVLTEGYYTFTGLDIPKADAAAGIRVCCDVVAGTGTEDDPFPIT